MKILRKEMKMKRIVKFVMALAIAVSLCACSSAPAVDQEEPSKMTDGTYTASAQGNNSEITVHVTISNDKITEITMEGNDSNHIQVEVENILPARIIEAQSTGVDTVSGATITSRAVLTAVKDCVAQAGGDLSQKPSVETTNEEITCDVVVVGAGLSGLTAANKLLAEGVNVVVIEQLDITGGTTRFAGGSMFGTLDENYDVEELGAKYKIEGEKVDSMIASLGDIFGFYKSLGFSLAYENEREINRVKVFNDSIGNADDEGGWLWSKSLELAYLENGGTLLMGTKAVGIRTDETGAVVGIDAETKAGTLTIHSKYTVMATGSAAGNRELLAQYTPTDADGEWSQASVGSTGEGIAMMLDLGAVALDGWNSGMGLPYTNIQVGRSDRDDYISPLADANALFVDYDGVRKTKETTGRMFDTAYKNLGKLDAYFTVFDAPLADSLGFTDELETGLKENASHFFKADSLEELAKTVGFDVDVFLATVEEYNGYCETKEDTQFNKDPEFLNAIDEGPYYVVKHDLMSLDVTGGVHSTANFEVVNANGDVIPNLYAVGSTIVGDFVGFAGGSNFICGAYSSLTAAESIIQALSE